MITPKYSIGDILSVNGKNYIIESIVYWNESQICSYCMRRLEDNYTSMRYSVQVDSYYTKVA